MKTYKITEAGIVLVSASVCMCAEFLRRLVLQNGDIWFWRLYTEVANSKLQVGNTFSCRVIAQGQPLIVDHLHTGDSEYDGYVIGGKNGLTIVERTR